jgi:signal transduction histidine kinase
VRSRLWVSATAVAVVAAVVVGVPLLVAGAIRDRALLALGLPLFAVSVCLAALLAGVIARRTARPVEELAEAAGRLGTGDPRPVGRRYGVTELDQVADGLDSAARRVTHLLTADRELAIDASHQLRTPLTALSMRLEEMIASADEPEVVREEGTAALAQAERLADVVSQLLSPARRVGAGSAALISIDKVVLQQIEEWEPAFRRAGRKIVLIGDSRLHAYATPGGLAQVIATLLDNALMHGAGTVTIRRTQSASSVVIEVEDEGDGIPADLVSRIFERSVSGRPEGTGLGLSLARTMVAADGGRIVLARRRPPVFAVFLPRNPHSGHVQTTRSGPALPGFGLVRRSGTCGGGRRTCEGEPWPLGRSLARLARSLGRLPAGLARSLAKTMAAAGPAREVPVRNPRLSARNEG